MKERHRCGQRFTTKQAACLLCLCALFPLLSGCAATANPLVKAEATAVPGLSMELHDASASGKNVSQMEATLYYRYLDEPMLAAETRTLTVRQDEQPELAVARALLEGPSAGHSDLRRLFPETVQVESVSWRESILYVTFNAALLTAFDLPQDWGALPEWQNEAPLQRRLAIQSMVASLTESFPYTGVQILVYNPNEISASLRLENSFFLTEGTGLSDPQLRDEGLLLTPQNTARAILSAWQNHNYDSLNNYIATVDAGQPKPTPQDIAAEVDGYPTLLDFDVSGGSVSADGKRCVLVVMISILRDGAVMPEVQYPLALLRENGVWKINYSTLQALMNS